MDFSLNVEKIIIQGLKRIWKERDRGCRTCNALAASFVKLNPKSWLVERQELSGKNHVGTVAAAAAATYAH